MNLDDNTRSGLHYLALGIVVVLALLLADRWIAAAGRQTADPHMALAAFQMGYLPGNGLTVVDSTSSRGERLAWAALLAVAVATGCGLGTRALSGARRPALVVARTVLVAVFGWGAYAALFVPVRHFFLRDGMVVEWRYAHVGDLPLPFTRTIELHHGEVRAHAVADSGTACGAHFDLILEGPTRVRLASLRPRPLHCAEDLAADRTRAHAAAALLNGLLHMP